MANCFLCFPAVRHGACDELSLHFLDTAFLVASLIVSECFFCTAKVSVVIHDELLVVAIETLDQGFFDTVVNKEASPSPDQLDAAELRFEISVCKPTLAFFKTERALRLLVIVDSNANNDVEKGDNVDPKNCFHKAEEVIS